MVIDTSFVLWWPKIVRHVRSPPPDRLHRCTYDHDGILGWWVWDIRKTLLIGSFGRSTRASLPTLRMRCSMADAARGSNPPPSIGWGCRHPVHQSLHGLPSSPYVLVEDMVFVLCSEFRVSLGFSLCVVSYAGPASRALDPWVIFVTTTS